jgi:hypothetical protein
METKNEMYLMCSEHVVKHFKPEKCSKPRMFGDEKYYVAFLDFDEIEEWYENLEELDSYFVFAQEITSGTMDVSNISKNKVKNNNIFDLIYRELNLSTHKNLALSIGSIADNLGMNPIELFNLSKKKY